MPIHIAIPNSMSYALLCPLSVVLPPFFLTFEPTSPHPIVTLDTCPHPSLFFQPSHPSCLRRPRPCVPFSFDLSDLMLLVARKDFWTFHQVYIVLFSRLVFAILFFSFICWSSTIYILPCTPPKYPQLPKIQILSCGSHDFRTCQHLSHSCGQVILRGCKMWCKTTKCILHTILWSAKSFVCSVVMETGKSFCNTMPVGTLQQAFQPYNHLVMAPGMTKI